jgi:hypothetical protein
VGLRGALVLVVVAVTAGDGSGGEQLDLFGHPSIPPVIPGQRPPSRIESNDVDLMLTVAGNAVRCGCLLVGTAERVYARTDADEHVARVPRYEEDAVHQLLRRRWLTLGAAHYVTCGAAHLIGTAVLVPQNHPGSSRPLGTTATPALVARREPVTAQRHGQGRRRRGAPG